jgi:hypothetical protein
VKNQSACTLCTPSAITVAAAPSATTTTRINLESCAGERVGRHSRETPFHAIIEPAERIDALKHRPPWAPSGRRSVQTKWLVSSGA